MPTFPSLGEELGGYRIEQLIGRGGMSVVYLAEQLVLGRKVALKLLSPELSEDEEFRQRFIRESRLAGGLEHPNIIPVHEAGDVEGLLFIAMRYVEGSDLKALLLREGPLSLERTIAILSQAAGALDAAHARGLVHRDVKPGNLLVASGEGPEVNEHIYLSDFGLTKKTDSKSRMTSTGQFVGTLDYVAPEQIQGKDVTGRTDLYSLACVACECLTGEAPFERDSEVAVMYAHLQDPPPKPSTSRPDLPPGIDAVIERALAKDPEARFESCRAFMHALKEITTILPPAPTRVPRTRRKKPEPKPAVTPAASPSPAAGSKDVTQPTLRPQGVETQKTKRPASSITTRVAVLLAVPVLAGGAFLMTRDTTDPGKTLDDTPATEPSADPTTDTGTSGNPGVAPFPGQIAFLEETGPGSERFFVVVANPPDAQPRSIPGTEGIDWRNRRPDWNAAGSFFAFAGPGVDGALDISIVDPRTPRDVVATLSTEGAQGSVGVSPDGERLAFSETVGSNMDIYVWDRPGDEATRLTTFEGDDDSPEWSPDGDRIVFERQTGDTTDIYVMDADGSNLQRVTDTPSITEKLPEFHPADDTLILYHQQEGRGDFGLYVHDTDDPMIGAGVKIIDTPAFEMRPTWSPDGDFIAFDSDTEGNLDIFVIPFEGLDDPVAPGRAVQVTDGPHDEQSPSWGATP